MKKRIFSLLIVVALFTSVVFAKEVKYNSAEEFYGEFNEMLSDNEYAEIIFYDLSPHESGYYWSDGFLVAVFNGQALLIFFHSDFSLHCEYKYKNIDGIEYASYVKNMECSYDKNKVIKEWNRLIEKM
jgi:hypothetical protein